MSASNKKRWIVGSCLALLLLCMLCVMVVTGVVFYFVKAAEETSAIASTQEWARLSDFPLTRKEFQIETLGSAFTREFRITFRDTPQNIKKWLSACPGPASVVPSKDKDGWIIYSYPAGGGALFAEVRISPDGDFVRIRTYWS